MDNDKSLARPEGDKPETLHGRHVHSPAVDIWESDAEVLLYADLPGVGADSLQVHYEEGRLTIEGGRTAGDLGTLLGRGEYLAADYRRVFVVPDTIDAGGIDAQIKAGVLEVHLPKHAKAQPRKIEVKTG